MDVQIHGLSMEGTLLLGSSADYGKYSVDYLTSAEKSYAKTVQTSLRENAV